LKEANELLKREKEALEGRLAANAAMHRQLPVQTVEPMAVGEVRGNE
jgi:hypothetical protein